jgi:hypothetical protein
MKSKPIVSDSVTVKNKSILPVVVQVFKVVVLNQIRIFDPTSGGRRRNDEVMHW